MTDAASTRRRKHQAIAVSSVVVDQQHRTKGGTAAACVQQVDPAVVEALSLCHDAFLEAVAERVKSTKHRVTVDVARTALVEMGSKTALLVEEAEALLLRRKTESKAKNRPSSKIRNKKWTAEELAQQEALLAQSRDKLRNR